MAARAHPFEPHAWTNRFERWPKIQTELAAAVCAAGMSLPFPQREVRLLHDAPAASVIPSAASSNLPEPRGSAARAGGQQR